MKGFPKIEEVEEAEQRATGASMSVSALRRKRRPEDHEADCRAVRQIGGITREFSKKLEYNSC